MKSYNNDVTGVKELSVAADACLHKEVESNVRYNPKLEVNHRNLT